MQRGSGRLRALFARDGLRAGIQRSFKGSWSALRERAFGTFNPDRTLWLAVFALLAAGLVMVYSSSFIFAKDRYRDGLFFFKRHLVFSAVGIGAFLFAWRLPVEKLRAAAVPMLLAVTAALGATLIPGLSRHAGGAARWLNVAGFTFQPSELAKFAVILYVATQLSRKLDRQDNWRSGFLTYFIGTLPIYVLLLNQPDFGTAAVCAAVTFLMLLSCGVRMRYLLTSIGLMIPAAAILILTQPYRVKRVLGFLDPWSDPAHKGFQVIQSFLAFFSGKWFGVGLGNSHAKLLYLPEAHNDFIFAIVGEELGLFGVVFFVGLFAVLVSRGLKTVERLGDPFERGLAAGITSLVGIQAFFNMAVVLGLLPTKGLPLPLISYGGTALITMLFLLGILARLAEKKS
ncbi:MAG: putative lipid II flippase FtsW [Deltaproteobacteria bacterium]|nr:putative lipid II flippase FtsW [Deltaproteobacteria bacterium]